MSGYANEMMAKITLQKALNTNRGLDFSRYFSVATVSPKGFPTNRTMEFRELYGEKDSQDCVIVTCVDLRTDIVTHLKSNSAAEICWYFPLTREQFRLASTVRIVGTAEEAAEGQNDSKEESPELNAVRTRIWKKLEPPARLLFDRASPGKEKESNLNAGDLDKYDPQPLDPNVPSPNFGLLFFHVTRADYLRLPKVIDMSKPQHFESNLQPARMALRALFTEQADESWTCSRLHP